MRTKVRVVAMMLAFVTARASAQSAVSVVELGAVEAKSAATFANIFGVAPLADGRVMVNDGVSRTLTILDRTFANPSVVLDSLGTFGATYAFRALPFIPYVGDSTLFVDLTANALHVISPSGELTHVISAPKAADIAYLNAGPAWYDSKGNLYCRGRPPGQKRGTTPNGMPKIIEPIDSAPLIRANFETRAVDTVGRVKVVPPETRFSYGSDDVYHTLVNPLVAYDEWAVTSGGSLAIVRSGDYHIDWTSPSGAHFASPKLPFDWKRLTDDDKRALIDSARRDLVKKDSIEIAHFKPTTLPMDRKSSAGDVSAASAPEFFTDSKPPKPRAFEFVELDAIADYYPAIRPGAVKADLDNHLWILPTTSAQSKRGELVYDVVDTKGVLVKRVRMPLGRSIAGFGKNGIVYLMGRDEQSLWYLERAKVN